MKAYLLEEFVGPPGLTLSMVQDPRSRPGHVVVDVKAIGVNFPDLLATQGKYQYRPKLPYVPGCEIAGVISSCPDDSPWAVGDDVAAFVWSGGFAEKVLVPDGALMALPDGATHGDGAAMVVNYQTAHFALSRRGRVTSGETVLVLGAGGGIGSAAIQVAKGLGARVLAGIANDEQRPVAESAGADAILILAEGFSADVRDLSGGAGVDVVVDPLGDRFFEESLRCLCPEGRVLVVGFAAGDIPTLKVNKLLLRNASAVGVAWGAFLDIDPSIMETASRALAEMWSNGIVHPQINRVGSFEELPDLLAMLAEGRIRGKAVVTLTTRETERQQYPGAR